MSPHLASGRDWSTLTSLCFSQGGMMADRGSTLSCFAYALPTELGPEVWKVHTSWLEDLLPGWSLLPPPFPLCLRSRGKEQVPCSSRIQADFTEIIIPYPASTTQLSQSSWSCEKSGLFSFCPLGDLFVRVAQSKAGSASCRPLKVYCT